MTSVLSQTDMTSWLWRGIGGWYSQQGLPNHGCEN